MISILAISGSLRAQSSNTRAVEVLARLAPAEVAVTIYSELGALPHFNPDLDGDALPEVVERLRLAVGRADGLVICSPEYAHGVAGVMKNALDWLVPSLEFPETLVALINASPSAHFSQDHLRETLSVMSARLVEPACVAVPLQGRADGVEDLLRDPSVAEPLARSVTAMIAAIRQAPPKTF